MTTVLLVCLIVVGSAYVGHRCWPRNWSDLWRKILCRTIKPLFWRTGLRIVHEDYLENLGICWRPHTDGDYVCSKCKESIK